MSAVGILTGLLVLAYFGSILVGGRALKGFGLPSGTEFLILGIVAGPRVLGVISGAALKTFEPVTVIALSWTALGFGLDFGDAEGRRITPKRLVFGSLCGLGTLLVVGGAAAIAAYIATPLRGRDLLILALGIGSVGSGTTRHAIRWVAERYRAKGEVVDLVTDIAESDDIAPLLALALIFAFGSPPSGVTIDWPWWLSLSSTLGIGCVLGATCSALTDAEARPTERWGLLLGAALVGVGASMRLGQSPLSAMFLMGLTMSVLSRGRNELRAMLDVSERPVMLPALVLAGATVAYPALRHFGVVLVVALGARVVAKLCIGLGSKAYITPNASRSLGLALLPSGILTITIGLSCALRFPGLVGDSILAVAASSAVFGELVGPVMLRRELGRAGELAEPRSARRPDDEGDRKSVVTTGRRSFVPSRARARTDSRQDSKP
jgi:hypothetical protein